eukprot:CAMPEP_0206526492 /NCGR_PEP_ID=MMETSP0325_2-20121206/772_1 /ASSEMBLY_ACC=CAM_ASM_000347 /TAXON_ID=2866 /ORGANISM="Crypthecodinium cohnii, Strain Seligo" /LENGTH=56 /DNA_ID=CAMNT_0054021695 /DNA_START=404 /DNA_END=571 /DNA_ORIENTATION=-
MARQWGEERKWPYRTTPLMVWQNGLEVLELPTDCQADKLRTQKNGLASKNRYNTIL